MRPVQLSKETLRRACQDGLKNQVMAHPLPLKLREYAGNAQNCRMYRTIFGLRRRKTMLGRRRAEGSCRSVRRAQCPSKCPQDRDFAGHCQAVDSTRRQIQAD